MSCHKTHRGKSSFTASAVVVCIGVNHHLETSLPKEASGMGCLEKVVGKISLQLSWWEIVTYEFKVTSGFAKVHAISVCKVSGLGGTHCWGAPSVHNPYQENMFSVPKSCSQVMPDFQWPVQASRCFLFFLLFIYS